jgi:hypothetical protein
LADKKEADIFHRLRAFMKTTRARFEDALVIFWIVGVRKLENMKVDEEEERQR